MDITNETHDHAESGADAHTTRTDGGKTLARGRDALAKSAGPRLADFGVETGKALEPNRRGKKAAEPRKAERGKTSTERAPRAPARERPAAMEADGTETDRPRRTRAPRPEVAAPDVAPPRVEPTRDRAPRRSHLGRFPGCGTAPGRRSRWHPGQ